MRILIAGSGATFSKLHEFKDALIQNGEECKLVNDSEVVSPKLSYTTLTNTISNKNRLNQLISSFQPDIIFINRGSKFGATVLKLKIPVFFHLRGDYWAELTWANKTRYNGALTKYITWLKDRWWKQCFAQSAVIMPICQYLEKRVVEHYPKKQTSVLYSGIWPEMWRSYSEIELKHPCVGLVQNATVWGKTKELLTLPHVMKKMPDVTFYWAGSGRYLNYVLPELKKYSNFNYIGNLDYPDKVRNFLGTIDVYGLMSGIDMSPFTLLEAQLMKCPTVATNVGGVSENMIDGTTGHLVEKNDVDGWVTQISSILNGDGAKRMGYEGQQFVLNNFSWDKIVGRFVGIVKRFHTYDM